MPQSQNGSPLNAVLIVHKSRQRIRAVFLPEPRVGFSVLAMPSWARNGMRVHAATLSHYPVQTGTILLISGNTKPGDMIGIDHPNHTRTAGRIVSTSADLLIVALWGMEVQFRRWERADGEVELPVGDYSIWTAL